MSANWFYGFEDGTLDPNASSAISVYPDTSKEPVVYAFEAYAATGTYPTASNSTTYAKSGTRSMEIEWVSEANDAQQSYGTVNFTPVFDSLTVTAWVYVPSGSPDVVLTIGDESVGTIPSSSPVTVKDVWTQVSLSAAYGDIPAGAPGYIYYAIARDPASSAAGTVYVDDVSVALAAVLPVPTPDPIDTTTSDWTIVTHINVPKKVGSVDLRMEKVLVKGAATGVLYIDAAKADHVYYASDATADYSFYIRSTSGKTLAKSMRVGTTKTVAVVVQNGSTAYKLTDVKIDGTSLWWSIKWLPKKPSSGTPSGDDAYIFNITRKTSTTWKVLATWAPHK